MEKKEIVKRVEEILLRHEGNTSEGAIYWNFEWVGGKQIPTGGGGYRQEGGECVYADKAFYEEMANFISQELDRAREEGRREELESLDKWYYKRLEKEFNPFGYVLHEEIFKRISKLTTK